MFTARSLRHGDPPIGEACVYDPGMIDEPLTELGMAVPDSALARRARELIADVAAPFLVNHSVRSYAWAVELARHDELEFDAEILYVSAILHDIGLVPAYDTGGCFEIDGAMAAERFVQDAGAPAERVRAIYDVIALHMLEELPPDPASEVVLLWDSTGTDVTGHRFTDVRADIVLGVLAAYPRLDFKREFAALFVDQASRKPSCRVAEMVNAGKLEAIAQAPFDS
jgi:HD domain-containing protein